MTIYGWEHFKDRTTTLLSTLEQRNLRRRLQPELYDRTVGIDLTTNDYLGLRSDKTFQDAVRQSLQNLPVGAGASRLLGGEHPIFQKLERAFATYKGAESALYFSSGYAANEAVGSALHDEGVAVFSDALNHASIVDGLRLARLTKDQRIIFKHNDLQDLEEKLSASQAQTNFIYTESLFSMDGDFADLVTLQKLCERYRGVMIIDEAHAMGAVGPLGAGAIAAAGLSHEHLISINTCGKALGAQGALVCGPRWFRDLLINKARSFIYSTAPSPWSAAALLVALEQMPQWQGRRHKLAAMAETLRTALRAADLDIGACTSFIVPIILGDEANVLAAKQNLLKQNILVGAIRPPTVPVGTARLRISLTANLAESSINHIATAVRQGLA